MLDTLVTILKIYQTLKSMPKRKSFGPNNLNVKFYLFYWDVVGQHPYEAIKYFLYNMLLPNYWGRTFIALTSKVNSLNPVSKFRPISLCNVSYKITSKIFTNHFKKIIHSLMDLEQSGFLVVMSSMDNINYFRK